MYDSMIASLTVVGHGKRRLDYDLVYAVLDELLVL